MKALETQINSLKPFVLVAAVSGGVDSMVLADLLFKVKPKQLIIAHYDHGIRDDSSLDRLLVEQWARSHSVIFEYAEGRLGMNTSEAVARKARYNFLDSIVAKYNASTVVTAHHQDDILETQFINLIRGTSRKGLSSLRSVQAIQRPLLGVSKRDIRNYANANNIRWNEDVTNASDVYLRNYLRAKVIPLLSSEQRAMMLRLYQHMLVLNDQIDDELLDLVTVLSQIDGRSVQVKRSSFVQLPKEVALEYLHCVLHIASPGAELSKKRLIAAWLFAKTAKEQKVLSFGGAAITISEAFVHVYQKQ